MSRVSIIMNVRNGAATLRAALESALAQTYRDWELIVWDDHSTDDSAQVATSFIDPRIRYVLAPEETPLGQARDLAIRQAQRRMAGISGSGRHLAATKVGIADRDR